MQCVSSFASGQMGIVPSGLSRAIASIERTMSRTRGRCTRQYSGWAARYVSHSENVLW